MSSGASLVFAVLQLGRVLSQLVCRLDSAKEVVLQRWQLASMIRSFPLLISSFIYFGDYSGRAPVSFVAETLASRHASCAVRGSPETASPWNLDVLCCSSYPVSSERYDRPGPSLSTSPLRKVLEIITSPTCGIWDVPEQFSCLLIAFSLVPVLSRFQMIWLVKVGVA